MRRGGHKGGSYLAKFGGCADVILDALQDGAVVLQKNAANLPTAALQCTIRGRMLGGTGCRCPRHRARPDANGSPVNVSPRVRVGHLCHGCRRTSRNVVPMLGLRMLGWPIAREEKQRLKQGNEERGSACALECRKIGWGDRASGDGRRAGPTQGRSASYVPSNIGRDTACGMGGEKDCLLERIAGKKGRRLRKTKRKAKNISSRPRRERTPAVASTWCVLFDRESSARSS